MTRAHHRGVLYLCATAIGGLAFALPSVASAAPPIGEPAPSPPPFAAPGTPPTPPAASAAPAVAPPCNPSDLCPPGSAPAPSEIAPVDKPKVDWFLHGFRLGYSFMNDIDGKAVAGDKNSTAIDYTQRFGLKSPHMFLIGYELTQRMVGHAWLNILFVENVTVAGLEQSRALPSGNLMLGFEFNQSFQLGVGANLAPIKEKAAHMVLAAGWTPRIGSFYTPVHVFFIPDADGQYRTGATVGVNW